MLQAKLNDSITKERGGRHGGKGHEFQRYWALCYILQLDLEKEDWVVLLEFIEDVAVLDSESTPSRLDLFQLKKKEGASTKWTQAALGKKPKDGKSILAKLFESRNVVRDNTRSIAFVSNAPVDLELASNDSSVEKIEFSGSELSPALQSALQTTIAAELGCSEKLVDFADLTFVRSPLAMDDLENHAIGRVSKYLATKFPDHGARADVFCKALYSEIKVKATETQESASYGDLMKLRGISKAQFSGMLHLTLSRKSDADVINEIIVGLTSENVPFATRSAIKASAQRFLIDKAGRASGLTEQLVDAVESYKNGYPADTQTMWEIANWIADRVSKMPPFNETGVFDRTYLLAVVLHRLNR
ncbi:conserved hypothetical protein [Paraburkholderia unamae]|uniref:DUF4297 domain-containing protein n=1 Tax=Paraburkholderia unamae TaxID=219649 RepID=UPI001CAB3AC2|nr:DUF4297 domain-containing protein [Paraburkholderia unamae]CAG9268286.1 conserved hypothetical protein [Paraburkholderia unamae]